MSVYQEMLELALANGLPRAHKKDLLHHDKAMLAEHPGKPFVWLLYECGTHFVLLDEDARNARSEIVECIDHNFAHGQRNEVPPSKWFYCDGESIGAHLASEVTERVKAFDNRNYEDPMGGRPYDNWREA